MFVNWCSAVMPLSLPTFIVVGSVKCGTTSLHHYLSQHPEVSISRPKELDFFVGNEAPEASGVARGNWWRGERWYASHFDASRPSRGEISPIYVAGPWRVDVFSRMSRLVPDVRLLLLVREPMERLRSHFQMVRRNLLGQDRDFDAYVANSGSEAAISLSDYGSQIQCILDYFPASSLMVVESAALDFDRQRTLASIFQFIGVRSDFQSPQFEERLYDRRQRRFPSPIGKRILATRPMRVAKKVLPFTLNEALRNAVLLPFSNPEPSTALTPDRERGLQERFAAEVALARRLTGLALPSLGFF